MCNQNYLYVYITIASHIWLLWFIMVTIINWRRFTKIEVTSISILVENVCSTTRCENKNNKNTHLPSEHKRNVHRAFLFIIVWCLAAQVQLPGYVNIEERLHYNSTSTKIIVINGLVNRHSETELGCSSVGFANNFFSLDSQATVRS